MKKFEFNEKNHRYTLDGKPLTGVTTVLGVIAKPALIQWAANQAVDYIEDWIAKEAENANISELVGDFKNSPLQEARIAHTRKRDKAAEAGTDIHKWIEDFIAGKNPERPEEKIAERQVNEFLKWVEENDVKFLESEKRMYSEELWLGGTVDAVAEIKGKKYVVDFKTQAKLWDRTPFLQTAAYRLMLEEMGETGYNGSIIVLLPKKGGLETHYSFEYESDKEGFLSALKLYRIINKK